MGWSYSSGIYQGIVVNIEGFSRRKLHNFISNLNEEYGLDIEIILNDETYIIYELSLDVCFIYLQRESHRDEYYSYSSCNSSEIDDFGKYVFPRYFKECDTEYKLSEKEENAFKKLKEYFENIDIEINVYEMGIVEY